jgi:hypothetical protein
MNFLAFDHRYILLGVIGIAVALGAERVGAHDRGVYQLC